MRQPFDESINRTNTHTLSQRQHTQFSRDVDKTITLSVNNIDTPLHTHTERVEPKGAEQFEK